MGFFRFYGLVLREAFRHSLDIAQGCIFVTIMLAGLIVSNSPETKIIVDRLDLGGWQVAVIVFGSIIGFRLIMAPYWLWKAAQSRIVESPGNVLDYQFRVQSARHNYDKKKKAVQVGFLIKNSLGVPIRFEVENVEVTINGERNDKPGFKNMGSVVSPNTVANFDYDWVVLKKFVQPGTTGTASITYKFGIAGRPFARRATYLCEITFDKNNTLRSKPLEESEENV
jgi:hypothetical protein